MFVCLSFQDRTRSTLLGGLAKDLLEKNALILEAVGEEVRSWLGNGIMINF